MAGLLIFAATVAITGLLVRRGAGRLLPDRRPTVQETLMQGGGFYGGIRLTDQERTALVIALLPLA